ncbi:hypothetical protein I4U23_004783 [Adineta vaga]|nr:hypothetical protein I4U23_004783 [Adineta vaga]
MTIKDGFRHRPTELAMSQTYVAIIMWFSKLHYFSADGGNGSRYSRRLLRGLSPSRWVI